MRPRPGGIRRLSKAAGLGVAALLTVLTASACSSGSGSPTISATPSAKGAAGLSYAKAQITKYSGTSAATAAMTAVTHAASLRGKTVWYVPVGGSVPIMSVAGQAMAGALSNLGATVHTCDGNFQPTTVASCLEEAADQGAAGVVTAYVDYNEIPAAYNDLASHHIPVLLAGVDKPSDAVSSDLGFLSFDAVSYETSRLMGDEVIADSGGQASVLALRLTDSAATLEDANQAIAELQQHCPHCTVYPLNTDTAHLSTLASSVSAELTQHPGIDYVLGLDDDASAISAGIASADLTGKVKIVTEEGETAVMQRVNSGTSNVADVGFSAVSYGWSFANALLQLMSGDTIQQGTALIRIFDQKNTAGLTITPAAYATLSWYGTSAFESAYLKAWGTS